MPAQRQDLLQTHQTRQATEGAAENELGEMIAPKDRFRSVKERNGAWQAVVDSNLFAEACEAALAQMVVDAPSQPDSAIGTAFRMMGARDFIRVLSGLCDSPPGRPEPRKQNLTHG